MFKAKKDGRGNDYIEIAGVLTPNDWKDARVAFVPQANDSLKRPCIRIFNWSGDRGIGANNVDIPVDAIPALKQAIDYLMIKNSNTE